METILVVAEIGYLLAAATGLLLSFAGLIGGFAIHLQELIVNNGFVQQGWGIARDVANLGFVLVIIIIAFATILRREQYGAKKLLPKLIAAAILVNFSLTIGALLIDFSQTITNFFWSKISPENPVGTISRLIAFIKPQQLLDSPSSKLDFLKGILNIGGTAIKLTIGPYFIAIFNLVAFVVFLTLAFMLYIRFFMLSFLLVLSPMVYLFNIIPAIAKHFENWWSSFIKWVIFAPAVSFFIYLSFKTVGGINAAQFGQENQNLLLAGIDETIKIIFMPFLNMLLVIGFLVGGLIAANKMGITGAKGGMKILEKAGGVARGWVNKQAIKGTSYPLRTGAGRTATEALQRSRFGILRQLGRGLSETRMTAEQNITRGAAERVRRRSIQENRRMFDSVPVEEKMEIIAQLRVQVRSDNQQIREAALEALNSIPQNALDRDVRLNFLYGRGGEAGTPYGARQLVRTGRISWGLRAGRNIKEARPETKGGDSRMQRIARLVEEEAQEETRRAQQRAGGAGGAGGAPPGGAPPTP